MGEPPVRKRRASERPSEGHTEQMKALENSYGDAAVDRWLIEEEPDTQNDDMMHQHQPLPADSQYSELGPPLIEAKGFIFLRQELHF